MAKSCRLAVRLKSPGPPVKGRAITRLNPEALLEHYDALPDLAQRILGAAAL